MLLKFILLYLLGISEFFGKNYSVSVLMFLEEKEKKIRKKWKNISIFSPALPKG